MKIEQTRIHYRMPEDPNGDHSLWSGYINTSSKLSKTMQRSVVAKKLKMQRLPNLALVLTSQELESGEWSSERIREATLAPAKGTRQYAETVADVPTSFDDVQDMLKKFGLA